MEHYVYVLTNNNIPFYVGRTNNLKVRYYKHKWNLKRDFEMNVIDTCDEYDIPFLEAFYITSYRQNGHKLINNKNSLRFKSRVSILPTKETRRFFTSTQLELNIVIEKSNDEILREKAEKALFFQNLQKDLKIFLASKA